MPSSHNGLGGFQGLFCSIRQYLWIPKHSIETANLNNTDLLSEGCGHFINNCPYYCYLLLLSIIIRQFADLKQGPSSSSKPLEYLWKHGGGSNHFATTQDHRPSVINHSKFQMGFNIEILYTCEQKSCFKKHSQFLLNIKKL